MRISRFSLLLFALLLLLAPVLAEEAASIAPGTAPSTTPAAPLYAHSFALLIGINAYQHVTPLRYAVNDVTALRDLLVEHFGFPAENVVTLTDAEATKDGITRALGRLADKRQVGEDDRVLVYFSGHGQTVHNESGQECGFLIPADADVDLHDLDNPGPFFTTCLEMDFIVKMLNQCPARHVLLIADACYSGEFLAGRALESHTTGYQARLAALRARQVMTAGGQGEESNESGDWGHGAFTYKLLDQLTACAAVPGTVLTASKLYTGVRNAVLNLTGGKQNPQWGNQHTEGDFLFTATGEATQQPVASPNAPVIVEETTAKLQITTDPTGATVLLDGVAQAEKTPCTLTVEVGVAKTKTVEVASPAPAATTDCARYRWNAGRWRRCR